MFIWNNMAFLNCWRNVMTKVKPKRAKLEIARDIIWGTILSTEKCRRKHTKACIDKVWTLTLQLYDSDYGVYARSDWYRIDWWVSKCLGVDFLTMFPTSEQIMQCWWAYPRSCSAGITSSLLLNCQHLILFSARKLLNWDLDKLISVSDISVTSCAVIHDTCGLVFGRQIMKEIGTNDGHMPTSKFRDSILLRNSFLN